MNYCDKINCHEKGLICVPATKLPRVVIVGGGFAGLNLVKKLKNKPVQVVLFDKNNFHQFIPLLYQVATSGIEPDSIGFPYRKMFRKYKNLIYRMAEVTEVRPERNTIITSVGEITFDFLVIATGSTTNYFGNKDIERFSLGLKSLTDALDIRSLLLQNLEEAVLRCIDRDKEALGSVMIVGGGPAGVEMAGALAEFKRYILPKDYPELRETPVKIILVEGTGRLLQWMPERLSDKTYRYLKKMGVDIKLHTLVKNYSGDVVEFVNGEKQRVAAVLWTAGINDAEVLLGKVNVNDTISQADIELINMRLKNAGFEIISDHKSQLIEQIKNVTIDFVYNPEEDIKVNFSDYLSSKLNLDSNYISTLFSSLEGTTIEKYLINLKIERVKELLVYDEKTLSEIAFEIGYSSVAHLSSQFKKITGLTPSHFKEIGESKRKTIDEVR